MQIDKKKQHIYSIYYIGQYKFNSNRLILNPISWQNVLGSSYIGKSRQIKN